MIIPITNIRFSVWALIAPAFRAATAPIATLDAEIKAATDTDRII
jgi:hypothetical protein